jgi:hypothetical protein
VNSQLILFPGPEGLALAKLDLLLQERARLFLKSKIVFKDTFLASVNHRNLDLYGVNVPLEILPVFCLAISDVNCINFQFIDKCTFINKNNQETTDNPATF